MIKFFRNIRQTLLSQGKTGKYLKYAIGEIVLVVIGILIALQINNWNEKRKLQKLEKSYYANLLTDLQQDSIEFDFKIYNAKRNIKKLNNITRFINNDFNITQSNIESVQWSRKVYTDTLALILSVSQAGFVQFPQIFVNTITDLRSTGNIKLLKNETLKNDLIFYYNRDKTHNQWVETLMQSRVDIENALNGILNEYERVAYTLEEGLSKDKINFQEFLMSIKRKPEFRDNIKGMLHLHYRIIQQSERSLKTINNLINSLKKELQ